VVIHVVVFIAFFPWFWISAGLGLNRIEPATPPPIGHEPNSLRGSFERNATCYSDPVLWCRALLAIAALTSACADYDGGPLYRLEPPSDGWPAVVELEPDELYRFRLEVPPGTRGFSIYTEAPGEPTAVTELFAPDGNMLIDGAFLFDDGDRGPGGPGAAVLSMPNHDIDVSEGGIWRVGVSPGTEYVEVWSAVEVDVPARVVDVVTHMEEPFLADDELEALLEDGLGILGLTLGRLERRRTLELVRIDIGDSYEQAKLIPREDQPVLNVMLFWKLDGGRGVSPVGGLPRGGGDGMSGLAVEYDAGPLVLAHEIGHFLGLFHTTDEDGNDVLESTPPCELSVFEETPEQCPAQDNLMRPSASDDVLTEEQRFVIESSVLWHP